MELTINQKIGCGGVAVENGYDVEFGGVYIGYVYACNGRWFYETAAGQTVTSRERDGFPTAGLAAAAITFRKR